VADRDPAGELARRLGFTLSADPAVRAECVRVAGRLRDSQRKVIGFVPTSDDVGVPPLLVQLGLALVDLSGATIGFVDANVHWPAVADESLAEDPTADEWLFATRWVADSLALLTPMRQGEPGAGFPQLARLLRSGADLFEHLLVDLTGFDRLGQQLDAFALMDGVVLVAHAGRARERDLMQMSRDMPADKNLGVLLVG
jgi:hypothetical protein